MSTSLEERAREFVLKRFRVEAIPTLLILDDKGDEVTRLVGPVEAVDLAAELARATRDK